MKSYRVLTENEAIFYGGLIDSDHYSSIATMLDEYNTIPFNIVFSGFVNKDIFDWTDEETEKWLNQAADEANVVKQCEEEKAEELRRAILDIRDHLSGESPFFGAIRL